MITLSAIKTACSVIVSTVTSYLKSTSELSAREMQRKEAQVNAFRRISEITNKKKRDYHDNAILATSFSIVGMARLPLSLAEPVHEFVHSNDLTLEHAQPKAFIKCSNMLVRSGNTYLLDKRQIASARRSLWGGWVAWFILMGMFGFGGWTVHHSRIWALLPDNFIWSVPAALLLLSIAYFNGTKQELRAFRDASAFWEIFEPWLKGKQQQQQMHRSTVSSSVKVVADGIIAVSGRLVRRKWKI